VFQCAESQPLTHEITLRPVGDSDRAFLFALYVSTREDLALLDASVGGPLLEMQYRAQQSQYQSAWPAAVDSLVLVAGEPAGHMLVAYDDTAVRLIDVALLPQYCGRGVGATLLRELISNAGKLPVQLSVAVGNPAIKLYERLGFTITGESQTYFEMATTPAI